MTNIYQGTNKAQRKFIDGLLKAKAQPKMVYQTSRICPSPVPGLPPTVEPLPVDPYRRSRA